MSSKQKASDAAAVLGKRTATVASSLMLTRAFTFLIMGLTFIFITRYLGPSLFGVYTIAVATAGFFGAFGDLGISTMFIKTIPQYLEKKQHEKIASLLMNGYTILIIETLFFTIVAFLASGLVAQDVLHNSSYTLALQLVSLSIILNVLYTASYSVLIAFGFGGKLVKIVTTQTLLQSFVSAGLVIAGFGPIGPIIGLNIGYLGGLLYGVKSILDKTKMNVGKAIISLNGFRHILSFSFPLGLTNVVSGLTSNFSPIFLQIFSTTVILGNFGAANKAIGIFDLLLGSVGMALLPLFAVVLSTRKNTAQISKYFNYSLYFVFLFAAPIVFYVVMLSQQFSYTIFSGVYTLTPLYLALMAIGTMIIVIYTYAYNMLIGAGEVKKVLKYNIVAAVIQIILLFVLVAPFTGLGLTVLLYLIIPSVLCVLYLRRVRTLFRTTLEIIPLLKLLLAGLISSLFLLPLAFLISNDILLLIVGAAEQVLLYPIIVSLIGAVNKDRLDIIKKVTESIPIAGYAMHIIASYAAIFVRE